MSNSSLVTYTQISPNRTTPRSRAIDTITIHCVVGQVTAKQGCALFQSASRQASCNYVVGKDGSIGLCVEEKDRSWCTGGTLTVNGMTGKQNDHRAVTIEVACDPTHPYAITESAYNALVKLVADISKRNNMGTLKWKADKSLVGKPDKQNMTVHRWFANKACPGEYLYQRMGDIADKANKILKGDEVDMTKEEVKELVREEVKKAAADLKPTVYNSLSDIPSWAIDTVEKLVNQNKLRGDEKGNLNLSEDLLRALVIMNR